MFRFAIPGRDVGLRRRVGLPAFGFNSIVNHAMARSSNSRLPHMSQTQAGKLGTMISSSPSQVKYVMCRMCIIPAEHSRHGNELEDGAGKV